MNQIGDLKAFPFALVCIASQLIDVEANREILKEIFEKFVHYFLDDSEEIMGSIKNKTFATSDGDGDYSLDLSIGNECLKDIWNIFNGNE